MIRRGRALTSSLILRLSLNSHAGGQELFDERSEEKLQFSWRAVNSTGFFK